MERSLPHTQNTIVPSTRQLWRNMRGTVRYRCAPATVGRIRVEAVEGDNEFQSAWFVDLSRGGVGLRMLRPIPVGTEIQISLRSPAKGLLAFQAFVVHSTVQTDGEWLIGCRFATEIGNEELDELLE